MFFLRKAGNLIYEATIQECKLFRAMTGMTGMTVDKAGTAAVGSLTTRNPKKRGGRQAVLAWGPKRRA